MFEKFFSQHFTLDLFEIQHKIALKALSIKLQVANPEGQGDRMRPTVAKLISGAVLFLSIMLLGDQTIFGQIEIENKLPKNVPLKVEFKNHDSENWVHDLEIKVTNTGKKPISFLYLLLILDVKTEDGNARGFPFNFGNGKAAYSSDGIAMEGDPSIFPTATYTFKIIEDSARAWDLRTSRDNSVKPRTADFEFGWLSFGDGTGIAGGGKAYVKKKEVFDSLLNTTLSTPPENVLPNKTINFFLNSGSAGCSTRSEGLNPSQINPFAKPLLTSGGLAIEDTCHDCNSSNCPSPSGFDGPYWMKPAQEYLCQNCISNPLVNSFSNGNGCQDTTNGCYWMRNVYTDCLAPGDPPFTIQCVSRELVQCTIQTC